MWDLKQEQDVEGFYIEFYRCKSSLFQRRMNMKLSMYNILTEKEDGTSILCNTHT